MLMLITVLQQDFRVHYNEERIDKIDFTDSRDLFIHGMVTSKNGGTCVSMPVLYTAVARRLGYPVFLVNAKAHVFCRWEDGSERFNIEGTGRGMNDYDDDYYMKWPHEISEQEVESGQYLKSLNHSEAFSNFLASRAHCLEDTEHYDEAHVAYSLAIMHSPKQYIYRGFDNELTDKLVSEDRKHKLRMQDESFKQLVNKREQDLFQLRQQEQMNVINQMNKSNRFDPNVGINNYGTGINPW